MTQCLSSVQNIILDSNSHIWLPEPDTHNIHYTSRIIKTNSWFNFNHHRATFDTHPLPKTGIGPYSSFCGSCSNCKHNTRHKKQLKCTPVLESIIKCRKVDISLNPKQKLIINNWIHACTIMYNITINRINKLHTKFTHILKKKNAKLEKLSKKSKKSKNKLQKDIIHIKKDITQIKKDLRNLGNFYNTRNYFKSIRDKLKSQSYPGNEEFNINKSNAIPTHILDQSIRSACSNYKSAITNKFNGHIKDFHLRHLKYNRKNRVMYIEKACFNDFTMCSRSLGNIIGTYNRKPFDFKIIKESGGSDCTFKYNTQTNKYTLYVPIKIIQENEDHKYEFISLDPGLRTFMTGISESTAIEMGSNVTDKIYSYIRKIKKIAKLKLKGRKHLTKEQRKKLKRKKDLTIGQKKKKMRKKLRLAKMKLDNQIDDMHWKIIKYLTTKHRNVIIGNLSTKKILSNEQKQIFSKEYKRVIPLIKLYKFKQRLENKCKERRVNYKEVDEYYTSKLCSVCASYKKVKGKLYECNECGITIDRDINAARNIYMKRLM